MAHLWYINLKKGNEMSKTRLFFSIICNNDYESQCLSQRCGVVDICKCLALDYL